MTWQPIDTRLPPNTDWKYYVHECGHQFRTWDPDKMHERDCPQCRGSLAKSIFAGAGVWDPDRVASNAVLMLARVLTGDMIVQNCTRVSGDSFNVILDLAVWRGDSLLDNPRSDQDELEQLERVWLKLSERIDELRRRL